MAVIAGCGGSSLVGGSFGPLLPALSPGIAPSFCRVQLAPVEVVDRVALSAGERAAAMRWLADLAGVARRVWPHVVIVGDTTAADHRVVVTLTADDETELRFENPNGRILRLRLDVLALTPAGQLDARATLAQVVMTGNGETSLLGLSGVTADLTALTAHNTPSCDP